MEKILREVLAKDKSLLGRRDELIAALEKKVPADKVRDLATIKRAISLNVGEKFFVGDSDRDATKAEIAEDLKNSGMQTKRIDFVIDTFVKALDWDKPFVPEPEPSDELEEVDQPVATPTTKETPTDDEPVVDKKVEQPSTVADIYNKAKADAAKKSSSPMKLPPPPESSTSNQPPVQAPSPMNLSKPTPKPSTPNQSPVQPPSPPKVAPPQPTTSDDKTKKILIGLVCVLAVGLLVSLSGNKSNTPNQPPVQQAQQTQQVQQNQQPAPVEDTSYLNARTDLSLNGMDLGIPIDEAKRILGNPREIKNVDGYDRYIYSDSFYIAVINGKVNAFVTHDPKDKTLRGLHVGSTYGEVVDAYGSNSKDMEIEGLILHEYGFNSIDGKYSLLRFAVNSSNRVEYISIRVVEDERPQQSQQPTAPKSDIDENVKQAATAFVAYHKAITNKNFSAAFNLFTDERQANMKYDVQAFARGYSDTITSEITDLSLVSQSPTRVVMNYVLDARDRAGGGKTLYQQFSGQVVMVNVRGEWKIASTESRRINQVMER